MGPRRDQGFYTSVISLLLALAGLVAGTATFSLARHFTVQHAIERTHRPGIGGILTMALLAAVLAIACLAGRAKIIRPRWHRLARALGPLVLGIPLAAWQWWAWSSRRGLADEPTYSPWTLYLWMALLAYGAWRVALLIRPPTLSRRALWLIVAGGVIIVVGVHVFMQYELWNALSFGYHDIGLFARALHNAAQGRGLYMDSLGCVTLAEHADFLMWALAPFCMFGIEPFHLLVFVSSASLAAPAIIIAWYLNRRFASPLAGVLGAAAWLLLPAHGCLVIARGYGFHPIYLAVPLLVAGMTFGFARRWGISVLCMLLACLAREEVSLTVAAWAAYVALVEKRRLLGMAVAAASAAYFCCMVFVVIPHWRGEPYPWITAHYNVPATVSGTWGRLQTDAAFLATLLLPMAVLVARRTWLVLVALPALIETILTTNPELHNLSVHYYTLVPAVLFMAAIRVWEQTAVRAPPAASASVAVQSASSSARSHRAGWCLLVSACLGEVYLGVGPHTNNPLRPIGSPDLAQSIEGVRTLRSTLPRDLSVTASYRIAAHFLDQDRLWTVGNEEIGDLVVVDDRDNWDGSQPRTALARAMGLGGYQPILADYHFVALLRTNDPSPLARELRPRTLPGGLTRLSVDLGEGIRLIGLGIEVGQDLGGASDCLVTLVWQCETRITEDYRFGLNLGEGRSRWGPFYFARGAYPTTVWQPGDLYRDHIRIAVPTDEAPGLGGLTVTLLR